MSSDEPTQQHDTATAAQIPDAAPDSGLFDAPPPGGDIWTDPKIATDAAAQAGLDRPAGDEDALDETGIRQTEHADHEAYPHTARDI